jgi:molecular chaperone DnaK
MQRQTVDFGIDLGTTNSVISVAHQGTIETLKNGLHEITPSMVYVDKKGGMMVGHGAARNATRVTSASDVQVEFKREMGQDVKRTFENGPPMSPEELSAHVLRALRDAAAQRFGEAPAAAVITIPAMFELPQIDATARAAKLAGFEHAILLQEPVAAATAYGYQSDTDRAYWLVYDFGGGTFDVSLLAVRDGQLSVIRHAGDNYLGGADFDRAIVDRIIVPKLRAEYDLDELDRRGAASNKATAGRLAVLKVHAEELKKQLSSETKVSYYADEVFLDDSETPVDIEVNLERSDFEELIRPQVDKSILIAKRLLQDAGLQAKEIDKVLLVGGSTFVPLVQQQVAALGIPVDRSLDPMTVVSRGAAVFASSQRMPKKLAAPATIEVGNAQIDLEYDPVGKDLTPPVMGKVTTHGTTSLHGFSVTIRRDDGGWDSGNLPIDAKGRFLTNVQLREKGQSVFRISARNASGQNVRCSPTSFAISYGMSVARAILPQTVSVALSDGSTRVLIPGGTGLPATSEVYRFKTTTAIAAQSSDELQIAFLTGDDPVAEHCLVGNTLRLTGAKLRRNLPVGSDIEITATVEETGSSMFLVTIPMLDEQLELRQDLRTQHEPADVMRQRLTRLRAKLSELEDKAEESGQAEAKVAVAEFIESPELDDISGKIENWESKDHVAAGQARGLLVDAARKVKELESRVEWPARVKEYEEEKARSRKIVHDYGAANEQQLLGTLLHDGDKAVAAKDARMLDRVLTALRQLGFALLQKDPGFLAGILASLAEREAEFSNRQRARTLLNDGAIAMRRKDADAMQSIISELLQLLPAAAQRSVKAAVRSDII